MGKGCKTQYWIELNDSSTGLHSITNDALLKIKGTVMMSWIYYYLAATYKGAIIGSYVFEWIGKLANGVFTEKLPLPIHISDSRNFSQIFKNLFTIKLYVSTSNTIFWLDRKLISHVKK